MSKTAYHILPVTEDILKTMGEQIKLARLRRDLPAKLVAERAGISRASLFRELASLTKQGLIALRDGEICLLRPDELEEILYA